MNTMNTAGHLGLAFALTLVAAACSSGETTSTTAATTASSSTSSAASSGGGGAPGTTAGSGDASSSGAGGAAAALTVETYASDPAGPAVDSHLILGATEAVLVDSQFFKADTDQVIALVKASGKTLTTVFLTHAHPDHYLGLDQLHTAFPQAKIVTTKAVLDDFDTRAPGTLAYLQMSLGDKVAAALGKPEALAGTTITIDGQALTVVEIPHAGESTAAAGLALPDGKTLIAGDLAYNAMHLVLSECHWQGWLDNLTAVKAMGYATIYPGHGAKTDVTVLDADAKYIAGAIPLMDAAATAADAKTAIKAKFPEYGSDFLLGFSVDNYFMACKKP